MAEQGSNMSDGAQGLAAIENVKLVDIGPTTMTKGSKKRASSGRRAGRSSPRKSREASKASRLNFYEEDLHKGALVWHRGDGQENWLKHAYLGDAGSDGCRLRAAGGDEVTVPKSSVCSCNPDFLEGTSDLTNLTYLNEPSVLHNVRLRYDRDEIYTRAGNVLIAVNPFKKLPIYSAEDAQRYESGSSEGPHIFEVAQRAYGDLFETGKSQSVVISGESGSGKTENTKFVLRQLTQKSTKSTGGGVERAILQTNPILEAFGNAKTLRNRNSSRFGKLINIYFDSPTQISGANIYTYLLKKSRVVNVQKQERSYHIFYQLCKGCSDEERQRYSLSDASEFDYLNQSECFDIDGTDDGRDFAEVKAAFQTFGFDATTQDRIFRLLSGILHLGNVEFFEEDTEGGLQSKIRNAKPLQTAARLLDVDERLLDRVLTSRIIRARNEQMTKSMDANQALSARDTLAKHAYATLFEWLVKSMNSFIGKKKKEGRSYRNINLLDIYGFECFKINSFEQLCINYANERLQQLFNRHLIELEQREYKSENLAWEQIPYSGNDDCLELLEGQRDSFISIIADEINIPQASDATLALKLKDQLTSHSSFVNNARDPMRFSIAHYPGRVEYDVNQFLDKNRDNLSADLVELFSSNENSLLCKLLESSPTMRDQNNQMKTGRRQSTLRQQSVAATFKGQLTSLIETLGETSVHYVRCIKPNSKQVPNNFKSDLVLDQLKCCGVFEVVQMARLGYPTKFSYEQFNEKYDFLLGSRSASASERDSKASCLAILKKFGIDPSQYQFGLTRLFLRAGALGKVEQLQKLFLKSSVTIQSWFRAFVVRRKYEEYRSKVILAQAYVRRYLTRKAFCNLVRQSHAAVRIQTEVRAFIARREYQSLLKERRAQILEKAAQEQERRSEPVAKETQALSAPVESGENIPFVQPSVDDHQSLVLQDAQAEIARLREENRILQAALQQERELKLDFSEQLIVTEASYAQEFKAMKETITKIREYLAEGVGETMLQKCMEMQDMITDELQQNGDLSTRHHACVEKVGREFSRKSSIFDDDADFLEEVVSGHTAVDNMDCVYELKNLKLRFEDWKDGYKKKLAYLNRCLSKNANPEVEKLSGEAPRKKGLSKILGFKKRKS